jgi:hypothetical protein
MADSQNEGGASLVLGKDAMEMIHRLCRSLTGFDRFLFFYCFFLTARPN